jgi:hypothetical protein
MYHLEQWRQTQKLNWAKKKKQGLTLDGPQKKKINVHRNVALFRIFYSIFLLLKGHINENMNSKYA